MNNYKLSLILYFYFKILNSNEQFQYYIEYIDSLNKLLQSEIDKLNDTNIKSCLSSMSYIETYIYNLIYIKQNYKNVYTMINNWILKIIIIFKVISFRSKLDIDYTKIYNLEQNNITLNQKNNKSSSKIISNIFNLVEKYNFSKKDWKIIYNVIYDLPNRDNVNKNKIDKNNITKISVNIPDISPPQPSTSSQLSYASVVKLN